MTIAAGETILASDINGIKDDVDAITSATRSIVATSESTSSTSYTNLSTTGPSVTLTTGTKALVIVGAVMWNSTAGAEAWMSFDVSGASAVSASDTYAAMHTSPGANDSSYVEITVLSETSLVAGSNTFTAKYKTGGSGTAHFQYRRITVIPLGD